MLGLLALVAFGIVMIGAIWWTLLSGNSQLFVPLLGFIGVCAVIVAIIGQVVVPRRYR